MLFENKQRNKSSGSLKSKNSMREVEVITPEITFELKCGNEEAFKTVYVHYYNSIQKFLFSLLRSKEESEEITQDVFMTLWEKREQIDPASNIKSFIYTIARNAAMNFFDRQKVIERFSRTVIINESDDITSEDIFIAQETELLIKLIVTNMPKTRRVVFEMSQYQNMDHEAIATTLGISKLNVANHLAHARKEIKGIIALFLLFMST